MTKVQIAPLRTGDAEAVARLQDALWRATYSALLPAWVLDERDEADNITRWRDRATAHDRAGRSSEGARTLVAHDEAGVPIGWASTGPPREGDPPTDTELWSLYVATEHQGSGVAEELVSQCSPRLRARTCGCSTAMIGPSRSIAIWDLPPTA